MKVACKFVLALSLMCGPTAMWGTGFAMNALVMAANHSLMPVEFPSAYLPPEIDLTTQNLVMHEIEHEGMPVHSVADENTRLRFLDDWIVVRGQGYYSPGDLFEMAGEATNTPALIILGTLLFAELLKRKD